MTTIFINDGSILKSLSSITMFSNPLFLVMDLLLLLLFRLTTTSIKATTSMTIRWWICTKNFHELASEKVHIPGDHVFSNKRSWQHACQFVFWEKKTISIWSKYKIYNIYRIIKKRNSLDTCPIHTNTRGAKCISFLYSMLDFADIYTNWFFFLSKFVK